jgi:hypothetical protein
MYKLLKNNPTTNETPKAIQRISDGAFIPFDPNNKDYQVYLKWLELSNTPEPADE